DAYSLGGMLRARAALIQADEGSKCQENRGRVYDEVGEANVGNALRGVPKRRGPCSGTQQRIRKRHGPCLRTCRRILERRGGRSLQAASRRPNRNAAKGDAPLRGVPNEGEFTARFPAPPERLPEGFRPGRLASCVS